MKNKQEGFEEQQTETYAILSSHIDNKFYEPISTKIKPKNIFKPPLTIFNNILMTLSPQDNLQFEIDDQIKSHDEQLNSRQNQEEIIFTPLQSIALRQQKNSQPSPSETIKSMDEKVSDTFPKKYICVYNKFQDNLFLKSDLTIVIRNVSKMIKLELLKSIQSPFVSLNLRKQVNQSKQDHICKQLTQSNLIFKKTKRFQSQSENKREGEQNSSRKSNLSYFQLQKSLILNSQGKKKISKIQFSSNFQSGNLHAVFQDKLNDNLFYLFLTNDTNTHGYNQWFYFSAKYTGKNRFSKARFLIMNVSKQFKYEEGMKLLTLKQNKWTRSIPFNIYKNKFSRFNNTGNHLTVDFQYEFSGQKNESIFFAFIYPYTYSRLNKFLKDIKGKTYKNLVVSIQPLGKTELTNSIHVVKIEKSHGKSESAQKHKKPKQCILIFARQHSSETPSSFICQSLIMQLLSGDNEWRNLLKSFTFIVIPMMNPDGVIHGNSRTNIKGYDINRLWQFNKNGSFMSVQTDAVNNYIMTLQRQYIIEYTIDLHSHSKEYGSFVYSCENSQISKLFTFYFTKKYPECIYSKCKVNLTSDKRCTFRGQMYHRLGIKNSFTIQTSFYGFREDKFDLNSKLIPFTLYNFQNIASSLLYALKETQKTKTKSEDKKLILQDIEQMEAKFKSFRKNNTKNKQNQNSSDSDPQGEYLDLKERQENGQKVQKSFQTNNPTSKQIDQQKHSLQSVFRFTTQKAKSFITQQKSLQMIVNASQSLLTEEQTKKKRTKIYTTKLNVIRNGTRSEVCEISNQGSDNIISKKFTQKDQKSLDFRKTLRRGYRMAHSGYSFYEPYSESKKIEKKQEHKNYIIYPTSTDFQINHDKARLLHEKLFKGRVKIKNIKDQDRILKRMGKSNIIAKDDILNQKNLFTNKYLKQYSQRQELNEFLNIEKIDYLKTQPTI